MILAENNKAHGMAGSLETADWPPLTLDEVDRLLRRYPQAGGATRLLSVSQRPFSAASVVETPGAHIGRVFVKRHPRSVRDREGLLEEHRLLAHLAGQIQGGLVQEPLAGLDGETVVTTGDWTYEVHPVANGVDAYERAHSWTPFLHRDHARSAGRALAELHRAAKTHDALRRTTQQLVTSFTIFAEDAPCKFMEGYLEDRPMLRSYAEERNWRGSFDELLLPLHARLRPWLRYLTPLWTHNDFHASNLSWSGEGRGAAVTGIFDFGLADRTNAVHDLATAIERNCIEWLRMDEPGVQLIHLDHLDALLSGYEELSPLTYAETKALVAMLPLVHCEFALSETDYFLSILHSEQKAYLAYEGYFLAHAQWFQSAQGRALLEHLERWASDTPRQSGESK